MILLLLLIIIITIIAFMLVPFSSNQFLGRKYIYFTLIARRISLSELTQIESTFSAE